MNLIKATGMGLFSKDSLDKAKDAEQENKTEKKDGGFRGALKALFEFRVAISKLTPST